MCDNLVVRYDILVCYINYSCFLLFLNRHIIVQMVQIMCNSLETSSYISIWQHCVFYYFSFLKCDKEKDEYHLFDTARQYKIVFHVCCGFWWMLIWWIRILYCLRCLLQKLELLRFTGYNQSFFFSIFWDIPRYT